MKRRRLLGLLGGALLLLGVIGAVAPAAVDAYTAPPGSVIGQKYNSGYALLDVACTDEYELSWSFRMNTAYNGCYVIWPFYESWTKHEYNPGDLLYYVWLPAKQYAPPA